MAEDGAESSSEKGEFTPIKAYFSLTIRDFSRAANDSFVLRE
jgi:hypothetical protein